MLSELTISQFAIIDTLHLTLSPGFNVLTGETGAGKSIVVDAVSALLGEKMGVECVRTGAPSARVEGIFQVARSDVRALLAGVLTEVGIEFDDDSLILSREIHASGRTVGRINGRAVPLPVLQQVGQALVDIHGQSEHLSLLRVSEQINLLDRYAGLGEAREKVGRLVTGLRQVRRELQTLLADERLLAQRADLLRYQIDEIQAARLEVGEDEEIGRERTRLQNAGRLSALASAGYQALYEGSDEQRSLLDLLSEVRETLQDLTRLDEGLRGSLQVVEEVSFQLEDLAHTLRDYRDNIEFNPARLEQIEERLDLIYRLKRKYGQTIAEILSFGQNAARELESLSHRDERIDELRQMEAQLLQQLGDEAGRLSVARQAAAERLARSIEEELSALQMPHVRFQVEIRQVADENGVPGPAGGRYAFDTTGIDKVEFLISPNPGEPLKPLNKIASGGETSRLMLAMKSILAGVDPVPTLIFDEIDVGLGGRSGVVVGERLWQLTGSHQVICITHLPQIASLSDLHFHVIKEVVGERTATRVQAMKGKQQIEELAAMLGEVTPLTRQSAAEMIQRAGAWKQDARRGQG